MKTGNAWTLPLWIAAISLTLFAAVGSSAQAPSRPITNAKELLSALETADRGIETLQAGIRYIRRMVLQGDEQIRQGELYFRQAPSPERGRAERTFAVRFTHLVVGRRFEEDRQDWIFDGEWLIERRPSERQYVARQIAPPGENIDPLRLGEGPLPIPIGQRAADVLERYDAELVNAHAGIENESSSLNNFVNGSWQLRLTPKSQNDADNEFQEIRLWYEKETLLPRLAKTINRSGDEAFVQLITLRVNEPIRENVFTIEPPSEKEGWDIEIREHRSE